MQQIAQQSAVVCNGNTLAKSLHNEFRSAISLLSAKRGFSLEIGGNWQANKLMA